MPSLYVCGRGHVEVAHVGMLYHLSRQWLSPPSPLLAWQPRGDKAQLPAGAQPPGWLLLSGSPGQVSRKTLDLALMSGRGRLLGMG